MSEGSITRRQLLGAAALTSVAAPAVVRGLGRRRLVVVGAGAFGCWTAWHLLQAGAEVVLVDAWGAGNSRSSSGGESRVIRGIYGSDRIYSEMVAASFPQWLELQWNAGYRLYRETGALWMMESDDDSYVEAGRAILGELAMPVEQPEVEEAIAWYPAIDFRGVRKVALERRAGILSARRACGAVRDRFVGAGGEVRIARATPGSPKGQRLGMLDVDGERLGADAFVFACGPWLGQLFPEVIGPRVRPTRQEVFYFGPAAGDPAFRAGHCPVWVDFGERVFYGLPDDRGRGFKIADDTRGEEVDPTTLDRRPSPEALQRARAFLGRRFPKLADAPLLEARVCQYENSPDGHLIVDRHPELRDVWLVGGGSGHGFKLSPAVGELVAGQVLADEVTEPFFRLERLRDSDGSARTQMDSG